MRWAAIGAVTAPLLWFICWVLDARLGRRLMTSVGAWRLLDGGVSVAMISMAAFLAAGLIRG